MTKYVILRDDFIEGIANTRADAEEFVFSLSEERIYENFIHEIIYFDQTAEEFILHQKELKEEINHYQTLNGFILTYWTHYFCIVEVPVI